MNEALSTPSPRMFCHTPDLYVLYCHTLSKLCEDCLASLPDLCVDAAGDKVAVPDWFATCLTCLYADAVVDKVAVSDWFATCLTCLYADAGVDKVAVSDWFATCLTCTSMRLVTG